MVQVPVAVAQVPVCWSVRRNVATITQAIAAAGAGTLLVLPECALSGYDDQLSGLGGLRPEELAEAQEAVADAGRRAGVHVVCGTLLPEGGQWFNAAIYFSPAGQRWIYRKVNLAMHERGRSPPARRCPRCGSRCPRATCGPGSSCAGRSASPASGPAWPAGAPRC